MGCLVKLNRSLVDHGSETNKVNKILSVLLTDGISAFSSKAKCIVISGESGSGKTRLANIISNVSARTLVSIDAKDLSEVGYAGKDPITIFERLFLATGNDRGKAEFGIIHIDEFDKLCATNSAGKDVNGVGIQQSLLMPLDGVEVGISNPNVSRANPQPNVNLSTKGMIFVFTGSFGGESIKSPTDLIRCGFIPEISNRVDFFLHLERPSKEDLSKLTASGEYYDSAIEYARKQSIQVSFDQDFKMRLATEAYQMGGNYRSVSYLFNNVVYGKIAELAICGSKSHVFSSDDLEKKDD